MAAHNASGMVEHDPGAVQVEGRRDDILGCGPGKEAPHPNRGAREALAVATGAADARESVDETPTTARGGLREGVVLPGVHNRYQFLVWTGCSTTSIAGPEDHMRTGFA